MINETEEKPEKYQHMDTWYITEFVPHINEEALFSKNDAGTTICPYGKKKKVKLISYPIQYPRINSNFFRDLNMKDRTIKLS